MKFKAAEIFPLCAIFFLFSSALGEKVVEVVVPIAKLHFLPSASSDIRGYIRQGQRYTTDGESGLWYRVRLYGATLWVAKDAVKVVGNTPSPSTPAAAPPPASPPQPPSPATARETIPSLTNARSDQPQQSAQPSESEGRTIQPFVPTESAEMSLRKPPQPSRTSPAIRNTPYPAPFTHAAQEPKPSPPKQPSRNLFSHFTHIPKAPSGEPGKEIAFFQISSNETPVYALSDDGATVLTKVKKGDYFPFVQEMGSWCKIALNDTFGWVERSNGAIVNTPKSGFIDDFLLFIILAALLATVLIVIAATLLLRKKYRSKPQRAEPFHALVLAKSAPSVQCIISNKTISLEKYLTVIGFAVKAVHELTGAQKIVDKYAADAVFIDWTITDDIPGAVEVLFAGYEQKKLPLAIFYNVPDASDIPLIPILPRSYHLGSSFSDHDISKLITPTMLSRTNPRSGAAAALEGDIAEGNLPEIMQFIEIGKKNGCLLVESESPIGMLYFKQGRIVHAAAANGITGKRAIASLLGLKQGKFRFLLNKQPKTMDLNLSTLEVLMEWTKTEDEAHRD